ncbi:MAG: hypothetical protein H0U75_00390 [Legionella sp.]|nr:hypothetical protein [Legionella sp.]
MKNSDTYKHINHHYSPDHWALDSTKEGTCIAFVKFRDKYNYAIKLNPTDRRGYRMLVTFIGDEKSDIQSTFNRQYTTAEQKGLAEVTSLLIEIYKRIGLPIVQTAQAGNNSHSLDEQSGITQIGSTKEPSMLHTHIWGRGNPRHEYISMVPLDGPKPGEMFDMMAKTPQVPGNEKKIVWTEEQLKNGLQVFKTILQDYVASAEFTQEFSNSLQVSILDDKNVMKKINQTKPQYNTKAIAGLTIGMGLFAMATNYFMGSSDSNSMSPKL